MVDFRDASPDVAADARLSPMKSPPPVSSDVSANDISSLIERANYFVMVPLLDILSLSILLVPMLCEEVVVLHSHANSELSMACSPVLCFRCFFVFFLGGRGIVFLCFCVCSCGADPRVSGRAWKVVLAVLVVADILSFLAHAHAHAPTPDGCVRRHPCRTLDLTRPRRALGVV